MKTFGPIATTDAQAVTAYTHSGLKASYALLWNRGAADALICFGATGENWIPLDAAVTLPFEGIFGEEQTIRVKRAGSEDCSDIGGCLW